jgi:hypothetical protein
VADTERFQLVWPAWLGAKARAAARTQTLSLSAWLRQAVVEKLERDSAPRVDQLKERRTA